MMSDYVIRTVPDDAMVSPNDMLDPGRKVLTVDRPINLSDILAASKAAGVDETPTIPVVPTFIPTANEVEYDILAPGGGKETVSAKGGDMVADVELLARKRLMQLKMVRMLLKKQKRDRKNAEARTGRNKKRDAKRAQQKASRKKNR
jgi:hypothetical protein